MAYGTVLLDKTEKGIGFIILLENGQLKQEKTFKKKENYVK